ncbi:hypothetical protein EMIHUDRAFT_432843 [Emiliania huxleyi CCMP1516]|uniref:Uncharacterized protein n=2 Tax=Emiliania huxleyi TaxID=2903 RepID=A0A0D3IDU9_EMIH1|nr:hypothetical protein EMIHUDRAFT_432843 [Emiliania huxleyi CCMP1516]EOD09434.1 hypothetical protein EMIHUDRAFT_432843 [Emiliania huxleyi CCMP1516]|eukprot:XP_005761863.1 hypothetical protein EMIHUDRAFT_432843 [Emiliania huxleyi CCMP1516]
MLDAGPSSSIGDDLDRLEDILPSEPVDLSDWLEPPTLQSRVPSLKVEDLLVDTGPIAAYERLRISFLQQDAHRVDENHETGDKEYIYTNQRPFKVVLQAQGANGGPLPIDNLHLTVRLMLESGSDVEAESKQHGAHGPLLIGDTRVAVGSDGLATFELTLGRTALSSFCSGQRFCLLFRADLPADLLDEPRLAHLSAPLCPPPPHPSAPSPKRPSPGECAAAATAAVLGDGPHVCRGEPIRQERLPRRGVGRLAARRLRPPATDHRDCRAGAARDVPDAAGVAGDYRPGARAAEGGAAVAGAGGAAATAGGRASPRGAEAPANGLMVRAVGSRADLVLPAMPTPDGVGIRPYAVWTLTPGWCPAKCPATSRASRPCVLLLGGARRRSFGPLSTCKESRWALRVAPSAPPPPPARGPGPGAPPGAAPYTCLK